MNTLSQSLVLKLLILFTILVTSFGLANFAKAQSKYASCDYKVEFILNGKVFTGTKIYRDPKNKYQVKVSITQPDGTQCQPAFYWKLAYLQYTPSNNPNEPTEIPDTSTVIDSGQIVSNLAFTKTIDLGKAAAQTYVYTLFLGADSNFSSDVTSKQRTVTFTDDPKDGTIQGTAGGTVDTTVGMKNIQDFDKSLGTLFNPLSEDMTSPGQIIVRITNIALMLVGILAVIFIILGGFLMVTSAGNENRLKQGKQTLIWAVAGLILSLLSFSIVAIVQSIIT